MSMAERSMGLGLRALGRLAGSDVVDRLGVRKPAERVLYRATPTASRPRARRAVRSRRSTVGKPARLSTTASTGLFDLTPTDEQQMLQESFKAFGAEQLRPAALRADTAAKTPDEILKQAGELGLTMLGVPEELGGAVSERSAVTACWRRGARARRHGPGRRGARAGWRRRGAGLWGDGDQQATYLPAFVGRGVPPRPSRCWSRGRCSTRSS